MIVGSLHITCDWQYIASHELFGPDIRPTIYELRSAPDSVVHEYWIFCTCTRIVSVFHSLLFISCRCIHSSQYIAWPLRKYYCVCCPSRDCCLSFSFSLSFSLLLSFFLSFFYFFLSFALFLLFNKSSCAFFLFLLLLLLTFSSNPSERVKK